MATFRKMICRLSRWVLGIFFIGAGINHFIMTPIYLGMMPPWLPWPQAANTISGVAEILGGIGVLIPATSRLAGWGLFLLVIAVFPANWHVARQGFMPGTNFTPQALWWRLPFQAAFLFAIWWVALRAAAQQERSRG